MAYRKPRVPSLRKLIAALAGISILLLVLPTSWTSGLIGLVQILVPLQDASTSVAHAVADSLGDKPAAIKPEDFEAARQQADALAHQTAALAARVNELEEQVANLSATRHWDAGGTRIGSRGRLIPARVVVGDLLPWRSSELITTGGLQGVPAGAPVLTNAITIQQGEEGGLRRGMAILLAEIFVGWVEKVGPHVSRVKLLSDPSVQMKVRIGRFAGAGFTLVEGHFWLVGRGGSVMEIRDVEARTVQAAAVQIGDVVLSDPTSAMLPAALTIGTVSSILPDRDNPLFVHLAVKPGLEPRELSRVYVYDPEPEAAP